MKSTLLQKPSHLCSGEKKRDEYCSTVVYSLWLGGHPVRTRSHCLENQVHYPPYLFSVKKMIILHTGLAQLLLLIKSLSFESSLLHFSFLEVFYEF